MTAYQSLPVEIMGRIYHIKVKDNDSYVLNLAKMVNERMNEVVKATNTVDSLKVADMAALNLADECCKLKEEYEERIRTLETERARLSALIENALVSTNSLPDS